VKQKRPPIVGGLLSTGLEQSSGILDEAISQAVLRPSVGGALGVRFNLLTKLPDVEPHVAFLLRVPKPPDVGEDLIPRQQSSWVLVSRKRSFWSVG
jgi:hypothetical protein